MENYLFVLGRETELCLAELSTLLSVFDPSAVILTVAPDVAVVHPINNFDPLWWVNRLGGTRLIAKQLATVSALTPEAVNDLLDVRIREVVVSGPNVPPHIRSQILKGLKRLRPKLRYREQADSYAASGLSERLIRRDDAAEVLVIKTGAEFVISTVVAVQNAHAWAERDRGLPAVDAVAGMLPPKLARIMVNLAEPSRHRRDALSAPSADRESNGLNHSGVLFDPFCGSGQIPIEALRLGWKVRASDLDPNAIERTNANLDWAIGRYELDRTAILDVSQADISSVTQDVSPASIDAIVAEPDLGPALRLNDPTPPAPVLNRVRDTVAATFTAGRTLLRITGGLILVIPKIAGVRIYDRLDAGATSGYILEESFTYARPDARVEREIFVFDKK